MDCLFLYFVLVPYFFEKLLERKRCGVVNTAAKEFFYRDEKLIISRIQVSVYRDKKNVISR